MYYNIENIFCIIFISVIILSNNSEGYSLAQFSNYNLDYPPVAKYYLSVLKYFLKNKSNKTEDSNNIKIKINNIVEHTNVCDKYLTTELQYGIASKIFNTNNNSEFLSFEKAINLTNICYRNLFARKINDNKLFKNFKIEDYKELDPLSMIFLMRDIKTFLSRNFTNELKNIFPVYYENIVSYLNNSLINERKLIKNNKKYLLRYFFFYKSI